MCGKYLCTVLRLIVATAKVFDDQHKKDAINKSRLTLFFLSVCIFVLIRHRCAGVSLRRFVKNCIAAMICFVSVVLLATKSHQILVIKTLLFSQLIYLFLFNLNTSTALRRRWKKYQLNTVFTAPEPIFMFPGRVCVSAENCFSSTFI